MSPRRTPVPKIAVATVILAIVSGAGFGYSQRNIHRVSIRPGEVMSITVEVPMQRFGRTKSFAKEANLPVDCNVSARRSNGGGVRVSGSESVTDEPSSALVACVGHIHARIACEIAPALRCEMSICCANSLIPGGRPRSASSSRIASFMRPICSIR